MDNNLTKYIIHLKKIMPHNICDSIINEYKLSDEWKSAGIYNGDNDLNKINKDIRNCELILMSSHDVIKNSDLRKSIDYQISEIVHEATKTYFYLFPDAMCNKDEGYYLLKYIEGGKYSEHVDIFSGVNRLISISFCLNDDFEGGDFSFFNGEVNYKLKKGDCLIFPSNYVYPHQVKPITSGTRYAIVTWMK